MTPSEPKTALPDAVEPSTGAPPFAGALARLTQRQQQCLRLVAQGYTSKQIGRRLGISWSTVDNHLLAATQTLDASGRADAARRFTRLEAHGQELPGQSPDLAAAGVALENPGPAVEAFGTRLRLLPPVGGQENDLSYTQRILAIARITLFSTLVFIACVIVIGMGLRALR